MNARTAGYWITTGLFCLLLGASGVMYLLGADQAVEGIQALGYPLYFLQILGPAKLAGAIVLLAPGLPLLKEWAYAGFTINLLAAGASHGLAGDPVAEIVPPLAILGVGAVSYLLRPATRRLAAAPSLGGAEPAAS